MAFWSRTAFFRWVAIATLSAVLSVACGLSSQKPVFTQAKSGVGDPAIFEVATEPAFPPFEFLDSRNQLQGFDIDLMNELVEHMGLAINYITIPFDGLMPMLEASTTDAAISAITITPDRMESIGFSRPYFKSGLAIAVRQETTDIESLEDLAGRTIAVKLGTTGADLADSIPHARLVTFDSTELTLQELSNGNVAAVINDAPATLGLLASGKVKGIKLVGDFLTHEYYGIGLPKDSPNKPFLDQALAAVITDGTYARIYRKWFKAEPPELPEALSEG